MTKILTAGLVTAALAVVIAVGSSVVLAAMELASVSTSTSGGLGSVSTSCTECTLLAAPVGFAIGALLQARRSRHSEKTSH